MSRHFRNVRIDARGHVLAVQTSDWDGTNCQWYALDKTLLDTTAYTFSAPAFQIDARGHILAVMGFDWSLETPGYRWRDLAGVYFGSVVAGGFAIVTNLRIDARGHVLAVQVRNEDWYNLAGQAV